MPVWWQSPGQQGHQGQATPKIRTDGPNRSPFCVIGSQLQRAGFGLGVNGLLYLSSPIWDGGDFNVYICNSVDGRHHGLPMSTYGWQNLMPMEKVKQRRKL